MVFEPLTACPASPALPRLPCLVPPGYRDWVDVPLVLL